MKPSTLTIPGALALVLAISGPLSAQVVFEAMDHDTAGKENCMMCHAVGVMPPVPDVPADHEGRVNETCLWCHGPDSPMVTTGASFNPHDPVRSLEADCVMCHTPGAREPAPDSPPDHEERTNETCLWCHKTEG